MKFTKTKDPTNQFDTTDVTVDSSANTLTDILTDFADFLKACGYSLPNNDNPLIVNHEDEE